MTESTGPRLIAEGPFFAQLWESVLYDPELNPSAIVVYAVLQRFAGESGAEVIFPSQQEIADRIGMNRDTVSDSLRMLVERGHITREKHARGWVITIKAPRKRAEKTRKCAENSGINTRKNSAHDEENFRVSDPTPIKERVESNEESNRDSFTPSRGPYTAAFDGFWKTYPKTNGTKLEAFRAWKVLDAEDYEPAVAGIAKWKAGSHWQEGKVVFAERYLKRRMWEDDPAPAMNGHAKGLGKFTEAIERARERDAQDEARRSGADVDSDQPSLLECWTSARSERRSDGGNVDDGVRDTAIPAVYRTRS